MYKPLAEEGPETLDDEAGAYIGKNGMLRRIIDWGRYLTLSSTALGYGEDHRCPIIAAQTKDTAEMNATSAGTADIKMSGSIDTLLAPNGILL